MPHKMPMSTRFMQNPESYTRPYPCWLPFALAILLGGCMKYYPYMEISTDTTQVPNGQIGDYIRKNGLILNYALFDDNERKSHSISKHYDDIRDIPYDQNVLRVLHGYLSGKIDHYLENRDISLLQKLGFQCDATTTSCHFSSTETEITYLNRPNAPDGVDFLTFRRKEKMTISLQFDGKDKYRISYDFRYAPDSDPLRTE